MAQLKRQLGFIDLFAIATGTMISSGFFVLPGMAAAIAGPSVIIAFLGAGLLALPAVLSKAELATALPKAGGTYLYIDRSMGPFVGTIGGLGSWLSLVLKTGFALVGFSVYFLLLLQAVDIDLGPYARQILVITLAIALTYLNIAGAKKSGGFQVKLVTLILSLLGIFVCVGAPKIDWNKMEPFMPNGPSSLWATIGLVFMSYAGVTKIASVAEEAQDPEKNIPRAMLTSLGVVTLVYVLGVTVIVGVLPAKQLHNTLTPVADAAKLVMGDVTSYIVIFAAVFAFISCANAGMMSASRFPFAMSRDDMLPEFLKKIGSSHTPANAILATLALVLFFSLVFDVFAIAKLASTFKLLLFIFVNIAVIVMRESKLEDYAPDFRSPLYPWMQIFGIVVPIFIIFQIGRVGVLFALGVIVLGIVWYFAYVQQRVQRHSAWTLLLDRMANKEATRIPLTKELREIQKERGLKEGDPFDEIVRYAPFIELRDDEGFEKLFTKAGQHFHKKLGLDGNALKEALLKLNKMGETPSERGIAIPHLRSDKIEGFHLILARSKKGLILPECDSPVHAIFVLIGSANEPSMHLRILAEIAVQAGKEDFVKRWADATEVSVAQSLFVSGSE